MAIFQVSSLYQAVQSEARRLTPAHFVTYEEQVNRVCLSIAWDLVRRLGLFTIKGQGFTLDDLPETAPFSGSNLYLIRKALAILEEEGVIYQQGDTYYCEGPVDMESPSELLVALTRAFPQEGASFQWLARAQGRMYDVVTGKVQPEDVLFPWGSFELVEEVYATSEVYGYYPKLAGCVVQHLLGQRPTDNLTFLEVGAGTGNGTETILRAGRQGVHRYVFTDVFRSMLKRAKQRFASYDFMEYKVFDLDKDPEAQGFPQNSFDMIIAINVLHATRKATSALRSLFNLLHPGGVVVISEIAPPPEGIYRYMELTFGMLPSYSSYEDREKRPLSPLLRPEGWKALLEETGFESVLLLPEDPRETMDRGGVILGYKPNSQLGQ